MMDYADLGPAMSLHYAEQKGTDALARFGEAKIAIIGLTNRIAYLENAMEEMQRHISVLHDLVMKK